MTQFALTDDQQALLDHADRFGRNELHPLASKMDDDEWWPGDLMAKLGSIGLLGATVGEQYGGAGMGFLEAGLVLQAFSRWNHAFGLSWVAHDNLCAHNIYANGNEDIRQRFLPKLCNGEWTGCALSASASIGTSTGTWTG